MPGGVNITGRIAYTGSATAEVPVKVEFTCANCGKATHNDIPVVISGSSGGYSAQQTAGKVALFSHDGAGSRMVRCVRDHLVQTPAESHVAFVYLPGVDSRHRGGASVRQGRESEGVRSSGAAGQAQHGAEQGNLRRFHALRLGSDSRGLKALGYCDILPLSA